MLFNIHMKYWWICYPLAWNNLPWKCQSILHKMRCDKRRLQFPLESSEEVIFPPVEGRFQHTAFLAIHFYLMKDNWRPNKSRGRFFAVYPLKIPLRHNSRIGKWAFVGLSSVLQSCQEIYRHPPKNIKFGEIQLWKRYTTWFLVVDL